MTVVITLILFSLSCAFPIIGRGQTLLHVVDGDTFRALYNGDTVKVRLCGVDAPESSKSAKAIRDSKRLNISLDSLFMFGHRSKAYLDSLLPQYTALRFEFDTQRYDRYKRLLAYVYLPDGRMLNQQLLKDGMAEVMTIRPNLRYKLLFAQAQREAQQSGKWLYHRE